MGRRRIGGGRNQGGFDQNTLYTYMKFFILKSDMWLDCLKPYVTLSLIDTERDVELLKPIEDVTIYEKESASFDAEISEADIPGEWKLKGELLRPSPVSTSHRKLPAMGNDYNLI